MSLRNLILAGAVFLASCASPPRPPVREGEPLGLQMVRTEAQLRRYPFRNVLDFETPADAVFVAVDGGTARIDAGRAHTGSQSLLIPAGARSLAVKLPAVLGEIPFPARWTLAGAYFYASRSQRLTISYDGGERPTYSVELPANTWTPLLLDIDGQGTDPAPLRFTFEGGLASDLYCDDLVLIDNKQDLFQADGFFVRERGFKTVVERPGAFRDARATPESSADGDTLSESNAIRARFESRATQRTTVIYADGTRYCDGRVDSLVKADFDLQAQHQQPARVTFAEGGGSLDRNSAGDANNDGYAELTGAYQLVADGPRLECTISPQTARLLHPVLEIAKVPAGKVVASFDGRLVSQIVRLDDGRLLVQLPGAIERPMTFTLRVER